MAYNTILCETRNSVGLITLHRPEVLNALSAELIGELNAALDDFEADDAIGCMVITGSPKAFAAGADISEMAKFSFVDAYANDFVKSWERVSMCRKPVIAAVAGYAVGGGCELAMMCDIIIAADNAKFGQPEITIGVMPGAGGSQRLTRQIGKSKSMEMCLTGRTMGAEEAERCCLVSRIVPTDELIEDAVRTAQKIASLPRVASMAIKESINRSYEINLAEGVRFERRLFHALFSTEDQTEGMAAFLDKRTPKFIHK
jgi:enoyl-CoA hydratase